MWLGPTGSSTMHCFRHGHEIKSLLSLTDQDPDKSKQKFAACPPLLPDPARPSIGVLRASKLLWGRQGLHLVAAARPWLTSRPTQYGTDRKNKTDSAEPELPRFHHSEREGGRNKASRCAAYIPRSNQRGCSANRFSSCMQIQRGNFLTLLHGRCCVISRPKPHDFLFSIVREQSAPVHSVGYGPFNGTEKQMRYRKCSEKAYAQARWK